VTSAKDRNIKPGAGHGPQSRPSTPAMSPDPQSLAREIERNDTPTQTLLDCAHLALDQREFAVAIPASKRVLGREPKNAEALTPAGFILYTANHVDRALARIDQGLRVDRKYALSRWDRARILKVVTCT